MQVLFFVLLIFVIVQRLFELRIASKNFESISKRGGTEFGAAHYPLVVALHTLFFVSLVVEYGIRGLQPPASWPLFLILFMAAQLGRWWVIRSMAGRWTTRVIVTRGETLVRRGPYRFVRHPNYLIVITELAALPLIFGLYYTAAIFSVLNALLLFGIRIPLEKKALAWSQEGK